MLFFCSFSMKLTRLSFPTCILPRGEDVNLNEDIVLYYDGEGLISRTGPKRSLFSSMCGLRGVFSLIRLTNPFKIKAILLKGKARIDEDIVTLTGLI